MVLTIKVYQNMHYWSFHCTLLFSQLQTPEKWTTTTITFYKTPEAACLTQNIIFQDLTRNEAWVSIFYQSYMRPFLFPCTETQAHCFHPFPKLFSSLSSDQFYVLQNFCICPKTSQSNPSFSLFLIVSFETTGHKSLTKLSKQGKILMNHNVDHTASLVLSLA